MLGEMGDVLAGAARYLQDHTRTRQHRRENIQDRVAIARRRRGDAPCAQVIGFGVDQDASPIGGTVRCSADIN